MNKSSITKIAVFLIILLIALEISSTLFGGGYWFKKKIIYDRNARWAALSLEPKGQIDVINFGDSLSTTALAPLELFRDYGITAYDMGQDGQTPVESFFALLNASKTQDVKVALFEVHDLFYVEKDYNFPMALVAEFFRTSFPILRYHYVWKLDWSKRSIRKYYKGFLVNDDHGAYTDGEYYDWGNEDRYDMHRSHQIMLSWMAKYCDLNGIKLVLYSAPSPKCYDITMHNTMVDLSQKYGVDYIDANYDRDKLQIDWENDTNDWGDHLNLSGSRKMTTYLGDYLSENCDLPNHNGDPAYREWKDLMIPYEQTIAEMEGTCYSLLEEMFGLEQ